MATTYQSAFDSAPDLPPDSASGIRLPLPRFKMPERRMSERMRTDRLRAEAVRAVRAWHPVSEKLAREATKAFERRLESAASQIASASAALQEQAAQCTLDPYVAAFLDSLRFVRQAFRACKPVLRKAAEFPHVEVASSGHVSPRAYAVSFRYLKTAEYMFDDSSFLTYMSAAQNESPLDMDEVWSLRAYLQFALLERLAELSQRVAGQLQVEPAASPFSRTRQLIDCIDSLRLLLEIDWKPVFEEIDETEKILSSDPLGAYAKMDPETRETYRAAVAELAKRSPLSEHDIARKAISLAQRASKNFSSNQRAQQRKAHVGYYLVAGGQAVLKDAVHYRPRWSQRIRTALRAAPDFFYFIGIETICLASIMAVLAWLAPKPPALLPLALLFLPAVEFAVAMMNLLITTLLPPERLPKLDFSKGIPASCATIVVVPSILSSEQEVRKAVRDLEVRFLGNRDPNLHFALLSDPPDSTQEFDDKDPLADICAALISRLNEKYRRGNCGSFFYFHRRRAFNPSEGKWMGWERKRGKLLEFNRFLLDECDPFPVKAGDMSLISGIRYVITLDLDTQLPAGAAHRLIGALAHPLNAAVVNPATNTVVEGYGILQPRVEISARSARRSRLAAIFSGDTGFDVYTRAVSDVYQDLFGEAIFSGKGIYEVQTFQRVLGNRFPPNAVLSHDLIEGAHARAGLVSDVEVIDDYPSHFSALSRRKHRWIRGDWQIASWLSPWVRDSAHRIIRNPLCHVSRWKVLDNLRRSMMDLGVFVALIGGWLFLAGKALPWTVAVLGVIFAPILVRTVVAVLRGGKTLFDLAFWTSLFSDLATSIGRALLRVAFLGHQTLVAADAIFRTLVRMTITHKRLLEWETAADAEASVASTHIVDFYRRLAFPVALALGALIYLAQPRTFLIAAPFLALWSAMPLITRWLDQPLAKKERKLAPEDQAIVRNAALRTWRFFREFSTPQDNWLVPDIVQLNPPLVARRISTTNLGLLLNSRLAAHDLGFLTLPEFAAYTENTFKTIARMSRHRGHLYNWYTTDTLEPVEPLFISTVDNGNLLCCLWTLSEGCQEAAKQPLFRHALWQSVHDHIDLLAELIAQSPANDPLALAIAELKERAVTLAGPAMDGYVACAALDIDVAVFVSKIPSSSTTELRWWAQELSQRASRLVSLVEDFAPWLSPNHAAIAAQLNLSETFPIASLTLESAPLLYSKMSAALSAAADRSDLSDRARAELPRLAAALEESTRISHDLRDSLAALAAQSHALADEMDFSILFDPKRGLLAVGYDASADAICKWHYDLLPSEARAASFAAIAQGDIPPKTWFRLSRSFGTYKRERVLLSWTGTMFEYLMPCLWMKTHPNTLLDRGARAAIAAHRKFAQERRIPWGMSESSCYERSSDGHYVYRAFGLSALALHRDEFSGNVVVAPYASFLAMLFDPTSSAANLRTMKDLGWLADYGFYDAADFTPHRLEDGKNHELVRNWMAHHQGMILVAASNALCGSAMQRRFHADPRVAAAERVLYEKAPRVIVDAEPEADASQEPASARSLDDGTGQFAQLRTPAPKFT